jgi:hypothetical protein
MTEIQNNKLWNFLGFWCLDFAILDTKLQGRAGQLCSGL